MATNVKMDLSKDKKTLTITVDLTERHGPSASGKTIKIGSTEGAVKVGVGDISLNCSVYTKEGAPGKAAG